MRSPTGLAVRYEARLGPRELPGRFLFRPRCAPINNALYLRKSKETTRIEGLQGAPVRNEEAMSPGMHRLDSSANWDSDSQRKFWNAWDTQHLQTGSEKTGAGAMRLSASSPRLILNDRGFWKSAVAMAGSLSGLSHSAR